MSRTAHGTFTIEREYPFPIARVFAAWADPQAKAKWFAGPKDWKQKHRDQEFRVGGAEHLSGVWPNGKTTHFDGRYYDIVPNERIIFAYSLTAGEVRTSAALTTVELAADGGGTRLLLTEQVAFLDGVDGTASRRSGWGGLLDRLGDAIRKVH